MTGATSTTGGGGGAAARTLPLLQPSAFSRSTALTKAVDICFIFFFPSIELLNFRFNRDTDAPESGRCSVGGNVARESSCRFRRVSHATALFCKRKSHTKTDTKLSNTN